MTTSELISGSLRLIGVLAAGETPTASEASDALNVLNEMLDSWSSQGLLIPQSKRELFNLEPGKQNYTMGEGGDFDTLRPSSIFSAAVMDGVTTTYTPDPIIPEDPEEDPIIQDPVTIYPKDTHEFRLKILTPDEWTQVSDKSLTSTMPTKLYREGSAPLEIIHIWPVPSVAKSLVLYSQKPLLKIEDASDDIEFPPGYLKAIRYNLAVELAPEYGKEASLTVSSTANESKADIMRANTKPVYMSSDVTGLIRRKTFNVITGE